MPAEALAKAGYVQRAVDTSSGVGAKKGHFVHYVHLLRSLSHPKRTYIGSTVDLKERLERHNAGGSPHASNFIPWKLVTYIAFADKPQALDFEAYLKTGSGRAFASKHLWSP